MVMPPLRFEHIIHCVVPLSDAPGCVMLLGTKQTSLAMAMHFRWLATWVLLQLTGCCDCGHVLMWMDYGSRSHFATWRPLIAELAGRGHQVNACSL